eukprot:SM000449S16318  [mRNA]  locus=s449:17977:19700:+ [translate_table: standard]
MESAGLGNGCGGSNGGGVGRDRRQAFVDDVINSVHDYCADGFDALEEFVVRELRPEGNGEAAVLRQVRPLCSLSPCLASCHGERAIDHLGAVQASQAVEELYAAARTALDRSLARWEEQVLVMDLRVTRPPPPLEEEEPAEPSVSGQERHRGDNAAEAELRSLRERLAKVGEDCAALRRELRAAEKQAARSKACAVAMADVAESNKHNAVIVEAADKLQELLRRANRLQGAGGGHGSSGGAWPQDGRTLLGSFRFGDVPTTADLVRLSASLGGGSSGGTAPPTAGPGD